MIPFYEFRDDKMQAGVGDGITFPPHLHGDMELIYVLSGAVETTIGERTYTVTKGQICAVFPNQVHSYKTTVKNTKHIILIYKAELCPELKGIADRKIPVNPVVTEIHEDVIISINRLVDARLNNEPMLIIDTFFQLLWARLIMGMELINNSVDLSDDLSAEVIAYISENFCSDITLEILSKKFGASRYKISRIFSKIIGIPFFHYLNAMRIDRAKGLLLNKKLDILTAGYECGFESQQTFNRVFKEECGVTPREFRNQITSQTAYKAH